MLYYHIYIVVAVVVILGGFEALKTIWRPLAVCIVMMLFQGMGGTVAIVAFMQTIFRAARFSHPGYATVGVGGLRVIATITAGFFVDKMGRKKLLIIGGLTQVFSMVVLAVAFFFQSPLSPTDIIVEGNLICLDGF